MGVEGRFPTHYQVTYIALGAVAAFLNGPLAGACRPSSTSSRPMASDTPRPDGRRPPTASAVGLHGKPLLRSNRGPEVATFLELTESDVYRPEIEDRETRGVSTSLCLRLRLQRQIILSEINNYNT